MSDTSEGEKRHSSHNTDEEDDPTRFQQQTVLEEVFTSDYNVTEEEVVEYCGVVGIDATNEPHLLPLAKAALLQPLPRPWTPIEDSLLGLYFFNQRTGESSWTHPVDALVRDLIARERTKSSCTDSYTEDLFTEEDFNISELLKVQVNEADLTRSDCLVNNPSDYIPTTLTSTRHNSLAVTEKPDKNRSDCNPLVVRSDSDFEELVENYDNDINTDEDAASGATEKENDTFVHPTVGNNPGDDETKSDDSNVIETKPDDVKDCDDLGISDKEIEKDNNVSSVVTSENTKIEPETKSCGPQEGSDCASSNEAPAAAAAAQDVECVQDPTMMFSGRDGGLPGRGVGRSPHDPPPLGTPPLAAPSLGRPVLGGGGPVLAGGGGARVPPLGGQFTPLAPIAAGNRGGSAQLAPLKPVCATGQQHTVSRDGRSEPILRRQPTQKEERGLEDGLGKQHMLKGERVPGSGRQVDIIRSKGTGDSTEGLGSPPKSILKGPVLAHSHKDRTNLQGIDVGEVGSQGGAAMGTVSKNAGVVAGDSERSGAMGQGVDRLLLSQPKETKNIRFDFKIDDLEFHSSEEDFDEEELEEEEEEEYDDEEEEEFDSEAEDPEEEAILRARGVIDDDSEGHGFMLNDASDLLSQELDIPLQKLNPLPYGPDPWSNKDSLKQISKEKSDHHDPLKDFRNQKEENKIAVEKHISGNALQTPEKQTEQKKVPMPTGQTSVKDSQITPKTVVTQVSVSTKPDTLESQAGKPKPLNPVGSSAQSTVIPVKNKLNETNDTHKAVPREKKFEVRPQEDRKLELEGAPKSRKTNPLDRVVAKLSGKTENKDVSQNAANTDIGKPAPKPSGTMKNLTVNLTEIMNIEEGESEEEESPNADDNTGPVNKMGQNNISQKSLAASIQQEAEVKKLRDQHQSDLKALQEKLNKEYQDMEEKLKRVKEQQESDLKAVREKLNKEYRDKEEQIRNEHKIAIQKFQEQEKKKLEQTIKQIQAKLGEDHKKDIENTKALLQKENAEKKNKLIKEIERVNTEEMEKIKLGYVQDMQQKKEVMQKEHEEEMQELEQELQALYSKQKDIAQEELDATKASVVSRSSNRAVAAAAAVADMERSLAEVLRERQTDIKREHNKELEILQDELDKELEKAARQAKEKETSEKKNLAARLAKMKEEHEKEVRELEESYEQNLNDLEAQHEEDLHKLTSDFKAELTVQKTELENKLTEFKIEYDQRINHVEHEEEMEGGEEGDEERQKEESMESDRKNNTPEERINHNENVEKENRRLSEEERKYDQMLRELRERRKSLEEDLEELKTQENKVKELKNQKLTQNSSPCCSEDACIHESKYKKMRAKYSNLVNRIKSEKAKKSNKRLSTTHEVIKTSVQNTPSLSSDKSSLESNINVSDSGQPSSDMTSSITSSPNHIRAQRGYRHLKSTSDASEDEEIRLATQVLNKYNRIPRYSSRKDIPLNTFNGHSITNPMTSTPKKAWVEDDLLVHGRKVLNRTEKFLRSNHLKSHHDVMDLTAEDIKKNIIQQNAEFKTPVRKVPFHRLSLAHGGSITSDTDSDEPTHDGPSMSSDFGLDQLLEKISSANKSSLGHHHRHQRSSQEKVRPLRAAASLERGLNKFTDPLNTYSSGYNTVSPAAPLKLEHLNTGSVPDLGPETVNRIASVNQYLQQKWTNYFGELSVPLGGKAGWPAQIIGQSTLLVNKNPTANFLASNNQASVAPGRRGSFVLDGDAVKSHTHKEDRNISQKIDDLRVWLEKARTTSDALPDN